MDSYNQTLEIIIREGLLESIVKSYGPLILAAIGLIIGYLQFRKQINRTMYEKRLSEVYAPLIGLIVKQEQFREWYRENFPYDSVPILELINEKPKVKYIDNKPYEYVEKYKLMDRNLFSKLISDINLGFARPELLKYIKQYELIIDIQDSLSPDHGLVIKASENQNEIEKKLLNEIRDGYIETVKNLGLDKKNILKDILKQE